MSSPSLPDALPAPRRPSPSSVPSLRWGVLGTGWIASRFVASLQASTTQRVVAVGSRTQASADAFAAAFSIERAFSPVDALVADPDVDVVYVATPHHLHREGALLAIEAGKHVLVEKPIGLNAAEAQEISAAAAAAGVFCMEAMWTLFLPRFDVVRQVLEAGLLGDVRTVLADHGEHFDPPHRILDPAMAGGSLLDLGTYVTTLATWALGPATRVQASGSMTADRRQRPGRDGADPRRRRDERAALDAAHAYAHVGHHRRDGGDAHPARAVLHARRRRRDLGRRVTNGHVDRPRADRPRRPLPLGARGRPLHRRGPARVSPARRGRRSRPTWPRSTR